MNMKIEKMFAFVADDGYGEGVVGFLDTRTNTWVPMVGADMHRVESIKHKAREIVVVTGRPIKLVVFEKRIVMETIEPKEKQK